jgi:hypothetical protein
MIQLFNAPKKTFRKTAVSQNVHVDIQGVGNPLNVSETP